MLCVVGPFFVHLHHNFVAVRNGTRSFLQLIGAVHVLRHRLRCILD